MRRLTILAILLVALLAAGCSSDYTSSNDGSSDPSGSSASQPVDQVEALWKQAASDAYPGGGGVVSTGDGRGCAKMSSDTYSCVAYVRSPDNSLDTGIDVAGTVDTSTRQADAHQASEEVTQWMSTHRCNPCD